MKDIKNKSEKNNSKSIVIDYEKKRTPIYYFIPLLLITAVVPLIVCAKFVDLSNTKQALYWTSQNQYLDFFSYYKSQFTIILTTIALIFYITLLKQKKLTFKNLKQYYIPLLLYAICAVLSTIAAKDTATGLWGFVDMYQGLFVLMSYAFITFLTINYVNNERDVNLFAKAFMFLILVEGTIGFGQYFGFDLFKTEFGKSIIVPAFLNVADLSFSFGAKTIYGTLFNSNFVGSFATLMLPLSIAFLMLAKTNKQKITSSVAVLLMIFIWIGCNSRAGYIGIAVAFIFAIWIFRKYIISKWKISLSIVVVIALVFVGLNSMSDGVIFNRLKTLNVSQEIENIKTSSENNVKFVDIFTGKDSFYIKTNKETLNFKLEDRKIYFLDESNTELAINQNENTITINDERYKDYQIIIPKDYSGITVNAYDKIINFFVGDDSVKIIGSGGRLATQKTSPFFGPLRGLETMGSNRGYEWGATIPMLRDYIFLGAGPDNFPIAFNQDDFVAKLNLIGFDANIVIDKPHNVYLQTAVNTGVISLIALLALFGIYVVSSLRVYNKSDFGSDEEKIGVACMISIIGYLAAGMFNDNVVSVAPLFWLILGIGISINLRVKNKLNNA